MKHKAQESLDTFKKCMRNVTNYIFNEKLDCEFKTRDTDNMQQLINCQLTVEEVNQIMNCLSVACFDSDIYNSIFNKLKQQKEMWENDDV